MKLISQGAEAKLYKNKDILVKERIKKSYRISFLDNRLRKLRTRSEAKLLEKANVFTPKVFKVDDKSMKIEMEFIEGKLLRDTIDKLTKKQQEETCKLIGKEISKLHEQDIIHGDLTTSNLILQDKKLYFIDFGLGFVSERIEDKAVDLHLLDQALSAKHYKNSEFYFNIILNNYTIKDVKERLIKVEGRGRYKSTK
tara:strand:- start:220 stop:810 length:591 start_codon:yes stop_codon:yes gene_type:complete